MILDTINPSVSEVEVTEIVESELWVKINHERGWLVSGKNTTTNGKMAFTNKEEAEIKAEMMRANKIQDLEEKVEEAKEKMGKLNRSIKEWEEVIESYHKGE